MYYKSYSDVAMYCKVELLLELTSSLGKGNDNTSNLAQLQNTSKMGRKHFLAVLKFCPGTTYNFNYNVHKRKTMVG